MPDDTGGRDVPFTGRQPLESPVDLWEDFARSAPRGAHHGRDGFTLAIGVVVALGFLVLGVHEADSDPTPSDPPATTAYAPPPGTTATGQR